MGLRFFYVKTKTQFWVFKAGKCKSFKLRKLTKAKHINTKIVAQYEGAKMFIKIVDYIGDRDNSSYSIRGLVEDALAKKITEADVYINSQGGSTFEATEMVNELKKLNKVTIRVGALAASAATYILCHFEAIANPSSQLMIHKPRLGTYGNVATIKADLKLLEITTADYLKAYATKTKKTEQEIEALWADGDYWMTANEALAAGFIDKIEDNGELLTENIAAVLKEVGAPVIPPISNNIENLKKTEMDKLTIIAALCLAADATDADIETALKSMKQKADAFDELKASNEQLKKLRAENLVAKAIAAKKIDAAQKETYEKLAMVDYEGVSSILEAHVAIPKLSAALVGQGTEGSGPRANWTIQDYLDKDPEALKRLAKENPEAYAELEKAY